jgi:hypothetical protein
MFRKTFIAAATVAALGAASLVPAAAAGVTFAGGAAAAQADTSPVVQIRDRYDHRDRYDRGRNYRRGHNDHRGHGYQRGYRRGQVCQIRPTRVVQWTPRGKIVRVIPQETCFFGGGRRWR